MKPLLFVTATLVVFAASPAAIAQTRTITVDTPNYYGERVVTRDREAGTLTRDSNITRKDDGAVASRHWERQRTDTGALLSGSQTNFNGRTRSFDGERLSNDNRFRTTGTITTVNGRDYQYDSRGRRTDNGWDRQQRVRNRDGDVVAGRNIHVRQRGNTTVRRVASGRRGEGVRRTTTVRRTTRRRGR